MHVFKKKVELSNFYTAYVNIINGILRLSKKECEVFSLLLESCKKEESNGLLTSGVRANVMTKLGMSASNFSRCIRTFREKGIVSQANDRDLRITRTLFPAIENDTCSITYNLNIVTDHVDTNVK